MKNPIKGSKGIISIHVFFIALMMFVILTSLLYMMTNQLKIQMSNNDSYRANYLAESIVELKLAEILQLSEEVIKKYRIDLYRYKVEYLLLIYQGFDKRYNPPVFADYVKRELLPQIKELSSSENNPFEDYLEDHHYKIKIQYDTRQNVIMMEAMGRYKRARRFIYVKLSLPQSMDNGLDEYDLPRISIISPHIVGYYRTIGL